MNWLTRPQIAGTAIVVVCAVTAFVILSPARLLAALASLANKPVLFAIILVILYLVRPLFAWPISPISALVGYVLGVPYGVPVALAGAVLTSVPPFLFARYLDSDVGLVGRFGRTGRRIIEVTGATRGVLAARISPIPADPVSYGAGFSDVSIRAYLVGTFVGEIPWVILEVFAGASIGSLVTNGFSVSVSVILGSVALAVLVLAGPAYRHLLQDSYADTVHHQ